MKTHTQIVLAVVLVLIGGFLGWNLRPDCPAIVERVDTVVMYDTIRIPPPPPEVKYVVRTETVTLPGTPIVTDTTASPDTVYVNVEVPIERKVYRTEDYKAEIEGFRASLVSMEMYRKTQTIERTKIVKVPDTRRWGMGVQAGYGVTVLNNQVKAAPFIGVGIQYNIISW